MIRSYRLMKPRIFFPRGAVFRCPCSDDDDEYLIRLVQTNIAFTYGTLFHRLLLLGVVTIDKVTARIAAGGRAGSLNILSARSPARLAQREWIDVRPYVF